jgi:hypothetical protein
LVEANALTANLSAAATELEPRREHAEFLMRELAHRGNNQLARPRRQVAGAASDDWTQIVTGRGKEIVG